MQTKANISLKLAKQVLCPKPLKNGFRVLHSRSQRDLLVENLILGKEVEVFLKGFSFAKNEETKNLDSAVNFSKKVSFPLVLKIDSPQVIHKSDVGGVKIVKNINELKEEYANLLKIAKQKKLKLTGINVQEFVRGRELIIGIKKDATFGHVLMFGLGGIYTEILKDVSFRVCPITEKDADEMINELKTKQLLFGARGEKSVNIDLLRKVLVKVSKLPEKYKNISELDINPFILNEKTGKIVDVRIVLER